MTVAGKLRPAEEALFESEPVQCTIDGVPATARVCLIRHGSEGMMLLAATGDGQVLLASPIYKDTSSQVSEEGKGFVVSVILADMRCTIAFSDVERLQAYLLPFKQLIASAVENNYRSRGRTHRWVYFYRPLDSSIGKCEGKSAQARPRSTTVTSESSLGSSASIEAILSNPFFTKLEHGSASSSPSSVSSESRVQRIKDRYLADNLTRRRSEFVEPQSMYVRCTTWNMAGTELVESLHPMLKDDLSEEPKLYAFAFQEMDLSRQAYLSTSQVKADNYRGCIEEALGEYYELVCSHQLVGMLLCVYAHKSITPTISDVEKSAVPTGFANLLGNKGAVGIRLKVFNTCFAFINCHLAAGQASPEKRNDDLIDIGKRIFNESGIWENSLDRVDTLFYMGDLNYRVELSHEEAHISLGQKNMKELLAYDQLRHERRREHALSDFEEADITFMPTYKFDIGTDNYDSSEKQRVPSWTDRVLVRSKLPMQILPEHYKSWPQYMQSDHKPVSAVIKATFETVLTDKLDVVRQEILRELDRHENEAIPALSVLSDEVDFGCVRYRQPVTRTVRVRNDGRVDSRFRYVRRDAADDCPCKRWCWSLPNGDLLSPGEEMTLQLTVCPDAIDAQALNSGTDTLSDILVIAVEGGRDAYLSIKGQWQRSSCGQTLVALSRRTIFKDGEDEEESSIPREIYMLCDLITELCGSENVDVATLFEYEPAAEEVDELQNKLEQSAPSNTALASKCHPAIALALLLEILDTLAEPLVPCDMYKDALASSANPQQALDFLDTLPSLQANVLIYLIAFLRSLLELRQGKPAPAPAKTATLEKGKVHRASAGELAGAIMGPSAIMARDLFVDRLFGVFGRVLLQPENLAARCEDADEALEGRRDEATRKRNLLRHWVLATLNQA